MFAVFIAALGAILVGKLQLGLRKAAKDPQTWIPASAIVLLIILHFTFTRTLPVGALPSVLHKPLSVQLAAQGWFPLLSLFLANALWMPVDLSTWQRISSVTGSGPSLLA